MHVGAAVREQAIAGCRGGRALDGLGAGCGYHPQPNHECLGERTRTSEAAGANLRAPRGKQPRPPAKGPKWVLSGKGGGGAQTARRLAQKQPSLKECVIAHWSSAPAPTIGRGSSTLPKPRIVLLL